MLLVKSTAAAHSVSPGVADLVSRGELNCFHNLLILKLIFYIKMSLEYHLEDRMCWVDGVGGRYVSSSLPPVIFPGRLQAPVQTR